MHTTSENNYRSEYNGAGNHTLKNGVVGKTKYQEKICMTERWKQRKWQNLIAAQTRYIHGIYNERPAWHTGPI